MRLAKAPANRTGAFASRFSPAPGYAAAARGAAAWPGGAEPGPRPFPPSFRLPGPIGRGAWLSAAFWRWWNLQPPGGGAAAGREAPKKAGAGGLRPPAPAFWLSKKWLAPLFRGFHSSLAPTARPGSYAEKPLLRKAFCGFAVHAAKSDYSLRGLRPPNPRGFFDRLKAGAGGLRPPAPAFCLAGPGARRAPGPPNAAAPPGGWRSAGALHGRILCAVRADNAA